MIQEFSIKNFLSIKDTQTLSFTPRKSGLNDELFTTEVVPGKRLLKSVVIYGANASGKTNILKALEFLRSLVLNVRKRGDDTGFIPFKFSKETVNEPGEFDIVFYHKGNKFRYYLKVSETEILEEELNYYNTQSPATVFYRKTINDENIEINYSEEYGVNKAEKEMIRARVLPNVTVLSTISEVSPKKEYILRAYNWFRKILKPIIEPGTVLKNYTFNLIKKNEKLKDKLTELMKKADFNIDNIISDEEFIEIDENEIKKIKDNIPQSLLSQLHKHKGLLKMDLRLSHLVKKNNSSEIFTLEQELESSGTWRYFGLAGPILEALIGSKILFIDEIDSSLHPQLINYIYSAFLVNSKKSQIIFTIHNNDLLADKELRRRDSIWFTDKLADGSTELYSIADINGVRKDKSFEKLYKAGKFGAIPNLGNLNLELDYEN